MQLTDYGFALAGEWQEYKPVSSGIRFRLSRFQDKRVVYAFIVDEDIKYIGICENDATTLKSRMGRYQSKCGGGTNGRIAGLIFECLHNNQQVQIYALEPTAVFHYKDLRVDLVKGLENPLIQRFNPSWNRTKRIVEVMYDDASSR